MSGWIKIHRKIVDWEWFDDHNTFRLFFYLLIKANHEDRRYKGELIERGQHICSLTGLADSLGLSVMQIRTSLKKLESTQEINTIRNRKGTKITICKYNDYQISDKEDNTKPNTKITGKQHESNNSEELKNIRIKENKNKDNIPEKKLEPLTSYDQISFDRLLRDGFTENQIKYLFASVKAWQQDNITKTGKIKQRVLKTDYTAVLRRWHQNKAESNKVWLEMENRYGWPPKPEKRQVQFSEKMKAFNNFTNEGS